MKNQLIAISALIGTIIGAGFLGIPYVVMLSGFPIGLLHLLIIGIIITLTMLYLGEIALRTSSNHQLSGYAEKYLGKKGKIIMIIAVAFGLYTAILAYLIGEGQSLSFLIFNNLEHSFTIGIIFWLIMSLLCYFGIKALEEGDSLGVAAIFIIVILIAILFTSKVDISNLSYTNTKYFFAPFGVVLFAYLAFSVVPEIKRILNKEKKQMKSTIIIGHIIAFLVYVLFTVIVLGFKGSSTPQLSTLALGKPFIFLGMLTMFTSYLSLSIILMDNLIYDFKISKFKSWLLTTLIPLILFIILTLTNSTSFTLVLGVGGVLSGGLMAILILFMIKSAKINGDRKPEYEMPYSSVLTWILIIIFILGATLEIINAIK